MYKKTNLKKFLIAIIPFIIFVSFPKNASALISNIYVCITTASGGALVTPDGSGHNGKNIIWTNGSNQTWQGTYIGDNQTQIDPGMTGSCYKWDSGGHNPLGQAFNCSTTPNNFTATSANSVDQFSPNVIGDGGSGSYYVQVTNTDGLTEYMGSFTMTWPNCNSSVANCGSCSPKSVNSCGSAGGNQSCQYTLYNSGTNECTVTNFTQDCSISCGAGYTCNSPTNGTCVLSTPLAPGSFSATAEADTNCIGGTTPVIDLSWSASSGATSYDIYRMPPGGSLTTVVKNVDTTVCSGGTCSVKDQGAWGTYTLATHTPYTYKVVAKNASGSSPDSNQASATTAYCDTTPPTSNITGFPAPGVYCYTFTTWGANKTINVTATDPTPPPSPSGVASVRLRLTNTSTSTVIDPPYYNMTAPSGAGQPWTYSLPASKLTAGNNYKLESQAVDNANPPNIQASWSTPANFTYQTTCINPYLKTTGGDVHSNTNIDIRGGP